ncbi:MAG: LPS export ABC transporter permease LptG [Syntrophaceae bacterium]|nr:LPS export ABC transporter permease LptG [Syntrophaceae bacterium]
MKTIDRYVSQEFLRTLLLITVSILCLFLIIDFFEKIRMFLSNHATPQQMATYFFYRSPMMLAQILPAAVLLTTLLTFGILSRHSEIIAMKANGISLYRISRPALVIASVVCLFIFLLSEWVTPYTNGRAETIRLIEVQKRRVMGSFKQDQIWFRGQLGIYNFRFFDPETQTLQGVTLYYLDREMNLQMRIDAERGEWQDGRWLFHNVLVTRFAFGTFPAVERSATRTVDIPEKPEDFKMIQQNVEMMGYFELRHYIARLQKEGYDATRYIVDLQGKIAFPCVAVILVVIGIAFSLRPERSGGVAQEIGVGLIIGFSYWLVYAFGLSLGRSGSLPPLLAAWFANLLFGVVSLWLILRIKT